MNILFIESNQKENEKLFLKYAEIMVETIGFKATLLLLTENFLDEQETGRTDGLIDIPVSTRP